MTDSHNVTIWDSLSLVLWSLFFLAGLVPEVVYHSLRNLAGVTTQHAFINSSAIISIGLATYLAFFVSRQCRKSRLSDHESQGKAIWIAIIALLAFLELPSRSAIFGTQTLLLLMFQSSYMDDPYLRKVIWLVGCCKLTAWCYLYSLLLRFHLLGRRHIFSRMFSPFSAPHHTSK